MQSTSSRLYAVRECSDVFVDAALRDDSGELLFLSIYGRDTALLHFFAAFCQRRFKTDTDFLRAAI